MPDTTANLTLYRPDWYNYYYGKWDNKYYSYYEATYMAKVNSTIEYLNATGMADQAWTNYTMSYNDTNGTDNSTGRDYSQDKTYRINVGDDIAFTMSESDDKRIGRLSLMIKDYFNYAIVGGQGVDADQKNSCPADCGSGAWDNMCCAEISAYEGTKVDYIYACMDQIVANNDLGVWIDQNYFQVSCSKNNQWGSSKSSANALVAGTVSLAAAAISLL